MPKAGQPVPTTLDTLEVLYEDNHIIAVNKRPSDIVQGDRTGDAPLGDIIKAYLKKKYDKPGNVYLGVVHRIDRPVSGVVLFARTDKALSRLNKLFQEKKVQKTYWAVVAGQPPEKEGVLVHTLWKDRSRNRSLVVDPRSKKGKESKLTYCSIGGGDRYQFLEILPATGRHHQIRVQLAETGCVIKGDVKYGARRPNKDASIHLHARSVSLEHPVKKEPLVITAPPPADPLWDLFLQQKG